MKIIKPGLNGGLLSVILFWLKMKIIYLNQKNGYYNQNQPAFIAKGIPQLFERIIQADGKYYFDAEDFIADESVVDL